jgi:hypothetical protein
MKEPSLVTLETLWGIYQADIAYERNKPILDNFFMEMGTIQLLDKLSDCSYINIIARVNRCYRQGLITLSGAKFHKNTYRRTVRPNGKGRTARGKANIVYTLTPTGSMYLKEYESYLTNEKKEKMTKELMKLLSF